MDFDEVSLVASGDDPAAKVVIAKAAPMSDTNTQKSSNLSNVVSKEGKVQKEISKDGLSEEVVAYIEGLEKSVDEMIEVLEDQIEDPDGDEGENGDEGAEGEEEEEPSDDDLSKSAPITKAEHLALIHRVNKAEAIAKEERDNRRRHEAIAKAETLAVGETAEIASLLMDLEDAGDGLADRVEKALRAASAQVQKSGLFAEVGSSNGALTTTSSLDTAVETLVKSDPTLSPEAAMAAAIEANPSLYDEYLKGNR